jgi:hypothetical protein
MNPSTPRAPASPLSANQVVSYRLREARELRGWTQKDAGERLGVYLGVRWSEASVSQAENSCYPGRRCREFTGDDLLALVRCFELPMAFFLVPPPGCRLATGDGGDDGLDRQVMIDAAFGTPETLPVLKERLLAWSAEHGRATAGTTPLAPELQVRLVEVVERVFGSKAEAVECVAKTLALLTELDNPANG